MKKIGKLLPLMVIVITALALFVVFFNGVDDTDFSERVYVKAYFEDIQKAYTVIKSFDPSPPEVNFDEQYIVMAVTAADRDALIADGFNLVEYPDYDPLHSANYTRDQSRGIPGFECYGTVEETYEAAQQIVDANPDLAQWIDVGDSWNKVNGKPGYDLKVLLLSNKKIPGKKPPFFLTASIHAREYSPAGLAMSFVRNLIDNYETDADCKMIVDYHDIHIMLIANPDARKHAEEGKLWRKNVNENYCGPTSDDRGADLNRNYPYHWGGSGTTTNQCGTTYPGASAASEPETKAIMAYMDAVFTDYNGSNPNAGGPKDLEGLYIDLHSYSELVLWPWGDTNASPVNGRQMEILANKFTYFNKYRAQQSVLLYPTTGTTIDYVYSEFGIPAYVFELGQSFFESCVWYDKDIMPRNLPAIMYAAKACRAPYILSEGPDVINLDVTGNTLTAFADDTRYLAGVAIQIISGAEYYIGTPPWEAGAQAIPMEAADGYFNNFTEDLTATLPAEVLERGKTVVYVRAKDSLDNWGPVSAIYINSNTTPTPTPTGTITPTPTATPTATPTTTPVEYINIAVNKKVTVSSIYASAFDGSMAVDGNSNSAWGSGTVNATEWIYVDLGAVTSINGVGIEWYKPYFAKKFDIYISDDGVNWIKVYTQNAGQGTFEKLYGNGKCRYVAVLGRAKNSFAYAIKEFEIYQIK